MMLRKMASKNHYCVVITGNFNPHSVQWREKDLADDAGNLFEPFTADIGLEHLIDSIFTNYSNLLIEFGVNGSLHKKHHHQTICDKISIETLPHPAYK